MAALHLTKVAVGCGEVGELEDRLRGRAFAGETHIVTRYRPTRHAELVGGSLYWIIRHQLVARSEIVGFAEEDGKCRIRLGEALVPVRYKPLRAHQGWRYLTGGRAPLDLDRDSDGMDDLPPHLAGQLAALELI